MFGFDDDYDYYEPDVGADFGRARELEYYRTHPSKRGELTQRWAQEQMELNRINSTKYWDYDDNYPWGD